MPKLATFFSAALFGDTDMQTFTIAPGSAKALWVIAPIVVLTVILVVGALGASALGARRSRFEVTPEGLRLRGDLYGRLIPASAIRTDGVMRVDFGITPGLTPSSRRMGTALPGYKSGWFSLRNGEKALLYLTDRNRAVYVPTTQGYSILLSPIDPDAFIAALTSRDP
jgi:hypothetical protein